jgi:lysophospholipase L1-like esterase
VLRRLLFAAALAGGFLGGYGLAAHAGGAVRVMPMGDSHTVGVGSSHLAGYRIAFLKAMQAGGFEVDMVGGNADGPEGFDQRHQGYRGATTYELSSATHEKMAKYQPDLVILLVGTNDAHQPGFSPLAFGIHFSVLVDRIFAANPDVKLVISTIPPQMYGKNEPASRALNDRIRLHVSKRRNQEQIRIVDIYNLIDDRLDMADPLHMNDAGYEKVGGAFADAALSLLRTDVAESP